MFSVGEWSELGLFDFNWFIIWGKLFLIVCYILRANSNVDVIEFFFFNFVCILDDFKTFMNLWAKCTSNKTQCSLRVYMLGWGFISSFPFEHFHLWTCLTNLWSFVCYFLIIASSIVSRCLTVFLLVRIVLKILEDICLLVWRIISNILLDIFYLLNEIKFIFLSQLIKV